MEQQQKTARLAGILFLMMVVFGLASEVFFRQRIFAGNDMALIAERIREQLLLYRVGVLSDMLMSVSYLLTALVLYKLFSPVDKYLSATMVTFASLGCVILLMNVLFELMPMMLLDGTMAFNGLTALQRQDLAGFFYGVYLHGYMVGQIFFALWVLPLGLMIIRSGWMPRILGWFFVLEAVCGSLSVIIHFVWPQAMLENILMLPMMLAEFSFMFYLLFRGVQRKGQSAGNAV